MVDYGNTSAGTTSAVLAIDAQTGHLHWSHTYKGSIVKVLVTSGNMLYIGNSNKPDSTIYAFDAISGAQHATYQISGWIMTLSANNNVLYVGTSAGLSALSLSDGKRLWYDSNVIPDTHIESYIVNKVLYIVTDDIGRYHVAAFNTSTGGKIWQDDLQDDRHIEVSALVVANGKVFVATLATITNTTPFKGNLRMYDARDGKLDWNTGLVGMLGTPAIDNNLVYVSTFPAAGLPSEVAALTLTNGHIQWKTQVATDDVTQAVVDNGVVYVSNGKPYGSITALNAATGRPLWTVPSVVENIFTLMVAN